MPLRLLFNDELIDDLRKCASEAFHDAAPKERTAAHQMVLDCKRINDRSRRRVIVAFLVGLVLGVII